MADTSGRGIAQLEIVRTHHANGRTVTTIIQPKVAAVLLRGMFGGVDQALVLLRREDMAQADITSSAHPRRPSRRNTVGEESGSATPTEHPRAGNRPTIPAVTGAAAVGHHLDAATPAGVWVDIASRARRPATRRAGDRG